MAISTVVRRLSLLGIFAVAGCGGREDPIGPGGGCGVLGTADVDVSGAVTTEVDGCAVFGTSTAEGETTPRFGLSLTAGTASAPTHILTIIRPGPRPVAGTYNVGTGTGNIAGTFTLQASTQRAFELTAGSITITQSSPTALVGSVSLTGTESTPSAGTVTISGNFSARCINSGSATC